MEKKPQQMWFKISVDYVSKYNKNLREKKSLLNSDKMELGYSRGHDRKITNSRRAWETWILSQKIETAIDGAQPLSTWPARMRS